MRAVLSAAIFIVALLALSASQASAAPFCSNTSWSDDTSASVHAGLLLPEFCPSGCNAATGTCTVSTGMTGMTLDVFIVIFIVAAVMLGLSFKRGPGEDDDGMPHTGSLAFPALAMSLFFTLAFASFNIQYITASGVLPYGTDIVLVLVCFIMGITSFFDLLWNAFHTFKGTPENPREK